MCISVYMSLGYAIALEYVPISSAHSGASWNIVIQIKYFSPLLILACKKEVGDLEKGIDL